MIYFTPKFMYEMYISFQHPIIQLRMCACQKRNDEFKMSPEDVTVDDVTLDGVGA